MYMDFMIMLLALRQLIDDEMALLEEEFHLYVAVDTSRWGSLWSLLWTETEVLRELRRIKAMRCRTNVDMPRFDNHVPLHEHTDEALQLIKERYGFKHDGQPVFLNKDWIDKKKSGGDR